jgi:hypothetical protein
MCPWRFGRIGAVATDGLSISPAAHTAAQALADGDVVIFQA